MALTEVIIAGFGGQGVLLAGTLIAQAAVEQGLYTTWFPSYGAEVRGGTANATVIVSDDEIGSPLSFNPNALVALNGPSLDRFVTRVVSGGIIIANSSIISQNKEYRIKPYFVPVTNIADKEISDVRTANMVAVGALIKALEMHRYDASCLSLKSVLFACEEVFVSKPQFIEINKKAVQVGYDFLN
ncbi:MAG: 2-oxoacid:acceptor oxidoreductase family protein [Endomicrobium sp.]|jgi:2-oxoglutarate ferredoxin oxidoreductase subunit gamma|nr:2-oxoacid:acceptor oxidoreductase family protein [Endomicrobium sp.]